MEPQSHAHVLQVRPDARRDQLTHERSRTLFAGQSEVGRTEHVIVYTDGSAQGDATAQAVLQSAEADYSATANWFGELTLPAGQEGDDQSTPRTATPVQVLMDSQAGGAYHFGCNATDIYLEPAPELASGYFVAELVEIFEAAINNGWDCGQTNGEGLSRVLAGECNANLGSLFVQTEQSWWKNGHADYVSDNSADDTNMDANGCATLFLYYLHDQLGFDWSTIVTTGGDTLAQTYGLLTNQDPATGFADFLSRLATLDTGSILQVPASGNPFPINDTASMPTAAVQPTASEPEAASAAAVSGASPVPAGSEPAVPASTANASAEPTLDRTAPIRPLDPSPASAHPARAGTGKRIGRRDHTVGRSGGAICQWHFAHAAN